MGRKKSKKKDPEEVEKSIIKVRNYLHRIISEKIGDEEMNRYYEHLKTGKLHLRNHNLIPYILTQHTNTYEEWKKLLVEALIPSLTGARSLREIPKLKFEELECTCGYDHVTEPTPLASEKGTPPPYPLCPMGVLVFLTLGKKNTNIILSTKPIEEESIKLKENLYITYTTNENPNGTIIYRKIEGAGKYTPVERSYQ